MHETNSNINRNNFDDEIDIRDLFNIALQGKLIILSVTALASTIGVIFSLYLPNIYESKALLVPVSSSSNISASLGSYSGLASLAGIGLPSGSEDSNALKATKKLTSLSFFEKNILTNIFLPDLMAVKSWNHEINELVYDQSIYNKNNDTWVRDYSYPKKKIPSAQESFEIFLKQHLNLNEDKNTGFITLSIRHQSPFIAKQWTELFINEVNAFYRQKDKLDSEKALSYLKQEIAKTNLSEIKQVIAELMQEETQKLTLIEANEFYVFDYIDPPAVMEKKSEPQRSLIIVLSTLLGGILSLIVVYTKHYGFRKED